MTEPITTTVVGIHITPAIAGAIGAISSMRSVANLRWYERLFAMINGAGAAAYLSPAISAYFALDSNGQPQKGIKDAQRMRDFVSAVRQAEV